MVAQFPRSRTGRSNENDLIEEGLIDMKIRPMHQIDEEPLTGQVALVGEFQNGLPNPNEQQLNSGIPMLNQRQIEAFKPINAVVNDDNEEVRCIPKVMQVIFKS